MNIIDKIPCWQRQRKEIDSEASPGISTIRSIRNIWKLVSATDPQINSLFYESFN